MIVENPRALTYLLTEDLYLLPGGDVIPASVQANVQSPAQALVPAVEGTDETIEIAVSFNAHGGYRQKFLVLVHYPEHKVMDEGHLTALESTIKRKGLNIEDIAILNLALYPDNTFDEINNFFKPQKLLILGKAALPDTTPVLVLNKITTANNYQLLYSYSFSEMLGNKDNTRAFWDQVKTF